MTRLALLALLLAGCGDDTDRIPSVCERWDDRGAVRCYIPDGPICYVALDGVAGCQCNGPAHELRDLCAETLGFKDGAR